jgi:general secretion pathway protein D
VFKVSIRPNIVSVTLLLVLLAGCASITGPTPKLVDADLSPTPPSPDTAEKIARHDDEGPISLKGEDKDKARAKAEIQPGSSRFVNEQAARAPVSQPKVGEEGQITFNFENQPIQAVVQAILGALLKENYTIAPTVSGNVTFSTSKPITPEQAMPILEMLLSWTNNTLVRKEGRYEVVPVKDAIPGNLTPRIAPPNLAKGYEVRVFPLRYISATEMQKLLKPYAKADAVVSADNARSMMVMAGTASELANYQHTIDVFDVDWLKGMSVGVYSLRNVDVAKVMPEMDKIFGATGESPLAGMFRFIPMETTNSVIVITAQPDYLKQAETWLYRLDTGVGENGTQLYVYDVKNVKAVELSDHLNAIFTGRSSGTTSRTASGSVAPGMRPVNIGGLGSGVGGGGVGVNSAVSSTMQGRGTGINAAAAGANSNLSTTGTGAAPAAGGKETDIRITPIEENNQLLVMATPGEWDSIVSAIHRLDVSPLQVQIETKILEVTLSGNLQYGVQWYLAGLIGTPTNSAQANGNYPYAYPPGTGPTFTGNSHDRHRLELGGTGKTGPTNDGGIFYSFLSKNFEVALNALQTSGNARTLSAPSMVVMNNQEAQINVGQQIPVLQQSIIGVPTSVTGTTNNNTNQFQTGIGSTSYINTGVVLDVKPRVNPGGLVYMDIQQEVSTPGPAATAGGNPPINQRQLSTQVAVQSGQTVLLGGLIQEHDTDQQTGLPLLSNIPVIGKLFGNTSRTKDRTELIVLITPRVITNPDEALQVTKEYEQKFESLSPLRTKEAMAHPAQVPDSAPPLPVQSPPTNKSDEGKQGEK